MNKLLPYLEKAFLASLIIGFALKLFGTEIPFVFIVSLAGLGITFFMNAYIPLDIEPIEGQQMGFNELLGLTILPKVLWISTAVTTIGFLLYTLQLGNDGYQRILYIGGSAIIISTLIMLILWAIGTKYLNATFPALFRAILTLLVGGFILFA